MKKLFCLLLCLMMISGCTQKSTATFMIQLEDSTYSLYNQDGKLLGSSFVTYEANSNKGYIITNHDNQYGYIDYYGEEIVKYGEYESLKCSDDMIVGLKEEKQYVLNNEGKVIFTEDENQTLDSAGLPIIHANDSWKVLYKNGEELYNGDEQVVQAICDADYTVYVVVFSNYLNIYYNDKVLEIKSSGQYEVADLDEQQCILYDSNAKRVIYASFENESSVIYDNVDAQTVMFDKSKNIIAAKGDAISLLKKSGDVIKLNSYYKDDSRYVIRGDVYGPHTIYNDDKIISLKDCQVYPGVIYVDGQYFPVYVENKGYQYHDFEGKIPFDIYYYEANPFDINYRAIVKDEENSAYLINDSGKQVTKNKYFDIKYIGSSYYAVYNEDGKFGIVNSSGEEVLPIEYTEIPEKCIIEYNSKEYLVLSKNGRNYLIDTKDYEVVFSKEGNMQYDDNGYFMIENHYYTFDGELIH